MIMTNNVVQSWLQQSERGAEQQQEFGLIPVLLSSHASMWHTNTGLSQCFSTVSSSGVQGKHLVRHALQETWKPSVEPQQGVSNAVTIKLDIARDDICCEHSPIPLLRRPQIRQLRL